MSGDEKVVRGQSPPVYKELADKLEQERSRLRAAIGALAMASEELAAGQADEGRAGSEDADVASDLAEAELDLGLERSEQARLARVDEALNRLHDGSYGRCARCDRAIEVERLQSLPWTELCSSCAASTAR